VSFSLRSCGVVAFCRCSSNCAACWPSGGSGGGVLVGGGGLCCGGAPPVGSTGALWNG